MTAPSPDTLAQMRALWEGSPELSAAKIGERLGVSTNTVIGRANRGRWKPRISTHEMSLRQPGTIFARLDALHATLDRVLAETRPWVEDRKPMIVRAA